MQGLLLSFSLCPPGGTECSRYNLIGLLRFNRAICCGFWGCLLGLCSLPWAKQGSFTLSCISWMLNFYIHSFHLKDIFFPKRKRFVFCFFFFKSLRSFWRHLCITFLLAMWNKIIFKKSKKKKKRHSVSKQEVFFVFVNKAGHIKAHLAQNGICVHLGNGFTMCSSP